MTKFALEDVFIGGSRVDLEGKVTGPSGRENVAVDRVVLRHNRTLVPMGKDQAKRFVQQHRGTIALKVLGRLSVLKQEQSIRHCGTCSGVLALGERHTCPIRVGQLARHDAFMAQQRRRKR